MIRNSSLQPGLRTPRWWKLCAVLSTFALTGCIAALYGGQDGRFRAALSDDTGAIDKYYASGRRAGNMDFSGRTLLHWHAAQGNIYGVRKALDAGVPVDVRLQSEHAVGSVYKGRLATDWQDGATPLYLAAQHGKLETVRLLIDKGADLHVRTRDGSNALIAAGQSANAALIELLLQHGIDPNKANALGETALTLAARGRHVQDHSFRLMGVPRSGPGPASSEASVRVLLRGGAKVDTQNGQGETALYRAAQYGQIATARLLLDSGADLSLATNDGRTPLHIAFAANHADIAAMLADRGAKPVIVEKQVFDFKAVAASHTFFADRAALRGDRALERQNRDIAGRYSVLYEFMTADPDTPFDDASVIRSVAYDPQNDFYCAAGYTKLRSLFVYRKEGGMVGNISLFDDDEDFELLADCKRRLSGELR